MRQRVSLRRIKGRDGVRRAHGLAFIVVSWPARWLMPRASLCPSPRLYAGPREICFL